MIVGEIVSFIKNDEKFSIKEYERFIDSYGLKEVWETLCSIMKTEGIKFFNKKVVNFYDIGRLYEIGLARENKYSKKECGKYYTPLDVSFVMAQLLAEDGEIPSLADTGCGCGNLIIEVLKIVHERSQDEFNNLLDKIYLFDLDETALKICVCRIESLFNVNLTNRIHITKGDFLKKTVKLPNGIYVIANPPYSQIKETEQYSDLTALNESKDLYIGFIEKIISKCKKAVIVSPQSFIVGVKFNKIREKLIKEFEGEIFSFDNVPGTLFDGRKEGVFNTNTANGVRASITKLTKSDNPGFRLTHLIRFKSIERKRVITLKYLKDQLGCRKQNLKRPIKCFRELEDFVYPIIEKEHYFIEDLVELDESRQDEKMALHINSSARYFIVCSKTKLDRNGSFTIYAKNIDSLRILYALMNSSYAYLWWRMFDGGILLPKNLLLAIPVPQSLCLSEQINSLCDKLIKREKDFFVYKKNANKLQQSIKFPDEYRKELNQLLFGNEVNLDIIHKNTETI